MSQKRLVSREEKSLWDKVMRNVYSSPKKNRDSLDRHPDEETRTKVCDKPSKTAIFKATDNDLTVKKIEIIDIKLRYLIPKTILNYLNHKKVKRIIRRGKIGIIVFDGSYNFYFHLGMTGKYIIYEKLHKVKKHDHLIIKFSNSITLVYNEWCSITGYTQIAPSKTINNKFINKR